MPHNLAQTKGGGGAGAVSSVFTRIGEVTAQNGDYNAGQITNTPAGDIASVTVQAALNELDTEKLSNVITTKGDLIIGGTAGVPERLAGNISSAGLVLTSYGDGSGNISTSWQPPAVLGVLVYYFTTTASDLVGAYKETSEPQVALTSITNASVIDGQLLATFITEPNNPNRLSIPDGEYSKHIHAAKTAGTKDVWIRSEIWETDSVGVDIAKIADLGNSNILTGVNQEFYIAQAIPQYALASATSRIKNKIYAVVGVSGSAPTVVLYVGDGSDSRMNLPSPIVDASNFVPYTGATTNVNLGAHSLTASNISGTNTGDQTITLTGDVTGGGTGTFAATLAASGVGAGTYTNANVTVDAKGRVTTITNGSSGSGGTVSVTNEVPTGTINGSNTIFTISNSATNNEIVVTLNGLKQIETTDYSLSGNTLTFVVAPFTGAILEVFYVNSTSSAGYQTSTKSTNYTLVNTDYVILADTTSSSFTLTLPTAVGQSGRSFVLKKVSYSNTLTIATTSSQTIDGDLTQQITVGSKGSITVHNDGANWYII